MITVLVAYASKHQSTKEIAQVIGRTLRHFDELKVDLQEVRAVSAIDTYDVVVLGSAIYIGQWRPEAVHFLKTFASSLASRPVWLFSSGPTGYGSPDVLLDNWRYPRVLEPLIRTIHPREMVVFHGKLDPNSLNSVERHAVEASEVPTGDYRNWNLICNWAEQIGRELIGDFAASHT